MRDTDFYQTLERPDTKNIPVAYSVSAFVSPIRIA